MEILGNNQKEILKLKMLQQKWRMPLMDTAEEIISEVDDVSIEALKIEKQSKGTETEKIKQNTQELWNNYGSCNIRIVGIPEGEKRENGTGEIFETVKTENFPNLMSDTKPNKAKNYIWLLLRNHASKKRMKWNTSIVEIKQSTNLEFCTLQHYPSKVKEK